MNVNCWYCGNTIPCLPVALKLFEAPCHNHKYKVIFHLLNQQELRQVEIIVTNKVRFKYSFRSHSAFLEYDKTPSPEGGYIPKNSQHFILNSSYIQHDPDHIGDKAKALLIFI